MCAHKVCRSKYSGRGDVPDIKTPNVIHFKIKNKRTCNKIKVISPTQQTNEIVNGRVVAYPWQPENSARYCYWLMFYQTRPYRKYNTNQIFQAYIAVGSTICSLSWFGLHSCKDRFLISFTTWNVNMSTEKSFANGKTYSDYQTNWKRIVQKANLL